MTITCHCAALNTGSCSSGSPVGISPMRRMSICDKRYTDIRVPTINATSCGGRKRRRRAGKNTISAKVSTASMVSNGCRVVISVGRRSRVPRTPPGGVAWPSTGPSWSTMRITPIPVMKPEITVYGIIVI